MNNKEVSTLSVENPDVPEITLRDDERQPCEVWTRVMGYHRPTTSFNVGKQGEFAERKYFREGACSQQACSPQMAALDEEKP